MADVFDQVGFVHLHAHTSFSLREGALTISRLAVLAAADRMPALAITDTNNLFGALEFSEKLAKAGVQPIIGIHLAVDFADASVLAPRQGQAGGFRQSELGRANLVLLAQSEQGYANLMRLASRAWLDPEPGDPPHIGLERLASLAQDLILLTGGPSGPLDRALRAGRPEAALHRLERLRTAFDRRLYVELQRHGVEDERRVEPQLLDLAYDGGLPLVATNEPFFGARSEYEAHDALICIAEGALVSSDDRRRLTHEHRFKTRAEMLELFSDLREATSNSVEIAMRCAYRPTVRKPILPRYGAVDGAPLDEIGELRTQAEEGLARRLHAHGPAPGHSEQSYRDRLAFELEVIVGMQFPGYFLIVADFIKWAKTQNIPVGPGRGSGAG
ncbi:MAG TPA: PHP domain-containing protein, partial [Beijerinckiaceae bacterium]|nr:PHP domain-containing protein [Beijerinckiaceae bacterium]